MNLPEKIRHCLGAMNKTQEWLAEQTGISTSTLSRLLAAPVTRRVQHLSLIAERLAVPLGWLLDSSQDWPPTVEHVVKDGRLVYLDGRVPPEMSVRELQTAVAMWWIRHLADRPETGEERLPGNNGGGEASNQ